MTTTQPTRSRNTRQIRNTRNATPGSGSALVATLERIWTKVVATAAGGGDTLPTVHLITGMGAEGGGIRLGHVTVNPVWHIDSKGDKAVTAYELFVSGEALGRGAVSALTTILHEATHLLAVARGVKDTSRGVRYHNARFVELAETFGLEYTHPAPSKAVGYSDVTLSAFGLVIWADELNALDEQVKARIPGVELAPRNPADPADPRMVPVAPGVPPGPVRRRQAFTCGCRTMTMFAEEFQAAPVVCGNCGNDFA